MQSLSWHRVVLSEHETWLVPCVYPLMLDVSSCKIISPPGTTRVVSLHLPRRGDIPLQVCVRNEQIALWGGVAVLCAGAGGEGLAVRRLRGLWL